jgi:hypothetical protein
LFLLKLINTMMSDGETGAENTMYNDNEVAMGGCDDLPMSNLDRMDISVSKGDERSHFAHDTIILPSSVDDGNDDTALDDGSDDDDDMYDETNLELFADGPSSPAHNKKSDKTKWCEREVEINLFSVMSCSHVLKL